MHPLPPYSTDSDRAWANGPFITDAASYPALWQTRAQAFRNTMGQHLREGLKYGDSERHKFDLFLPQSAAKGVLVFVHGGYWMQFDHQYWSHLAAGPLSLGWAVAIPSYTLAPEARISQITAEILAATLAIAKEVPGPMIVTGHSAGGHLAARMGVLDSPASRVVPISPLAELEPLIATKMNEKLRLDAGEVASESPARQRLRPGVSCHVWVGAQERPGFLLQARILSEEWGCTWTPAPEKHHFNVIDDLADPHSALTRTTLA